MRSSHKNRNRSRHRSGGSSGGGGGGGGNPLSRVYESNGPDVKVRGNAQTIADKYLQLGRDAQSSGDIVMAESYFQHAEHYLRIVFAAQAYNQQAQQQYRRPDEEFDDEDLEDGAEASVEPRGGGQQASTEPDGLGEQPSFDSAPDRERFQQHQGNRPPRDNRDRERDYNRDQNREQANQPREGRDRFRPRWQDRRNDGQPGEPRGEQRQNAPVAQPRFEEQPRLDATPAVQASAAPVADQWEAPSFLRRPAPAPAPVAEPVASEDAAAPPAAKRKYERRPRKEAGADEAKAD